jgi:hypothetical protein
MPCPRCGKVPERPPRVLEILVTTREEALMVMERIRCMKQREKHAGA